MPAISRNPAYALTAERYAAMLKHFLTDPSPSISSICSVCNVGRIMAKRALTTGWPELNLPALPDAAKQLVDPQEVHKAMAQLQDQRKEIIENLFGPEVAKDPNKPTDGVVIEEATKRAAEAAMASRVAMSTAVKSARAVEKMADHFLQLIEAGEVEMPEKIRPEHIFLLTKAADTAAGTVTKAIQAEKASSGEPTEIAGAHITNLLFGATPDELRQVALTGNIPGRLLGILAQAPKVIDVEPIVVEDTTPESE